MDMVSPIIDIFSRVMNCSSKHVNYLRALEEKLNQLKEKMEQLNAIKSEIDNRVVVAEEQLMIRNSQVNLWMQRVEVKESEVKEILLEGARHLERRCLNGCCPQNCWSSYNLGKKVALELIDVEEITHKGAFTTVAENQPLALEEKLNLLKEKMEQLNAIKSDVNNRVTVAEEQLMTRTSQVNLWMQRVEVKEREVEEILREGRQHLERRCLNSCCPDNCWSSLGKNVVKELSDVEEIMRNGAFETVAENPPRAPVQELPENFTVGLDSAFGRAWNLLQKDDVGVLGLYGVGGVGKTTLLKKINNEFSKMNNSFDIVIWVVISSEVNMRIVQEDIRERLGLMPWRENVPLNSRARDIFNALKMKKFLILLDDIWEEIDLQSIGIPHHNAQNKSKIVLTTRSLNVCGSMGARHKIEVNCLNKDQSWKLFEEKVGPETLAADPHIPKLGRKVAENVMAYH